ncbi:hypothetical protein [Sphingomonas aquatilis]|uniref:hypothetical protein n=1 Tax=Sphingomonas aquatilis TaxID=93063 RepID=UPI0023F8A98E|nr:hypothetical protein [Sphingomonas aquatilis]MCI4653891.1 hypothetical protein [Sphingomonas aquatilis]
MTVAARLLAVSDRLARLRPDWGNPERFFEERGELQAELRRVAREMERNGFRG